MNEETHGLAYLEVKVYALLRRYPSQSNLFVKNLPEKSSLAFRASYYRKRYVSWAHSVYIHAAAKIWGNKFRSAEVSKKCIPVHMGWGLTYRTVVLSMYCEVPINGMLAVLGRTLDPANN